MRLKNWKMKPMLRRRNRVRSRSAHRGELLPAHPDPPRVGRVDAADQIEQRALAAAAAAEQRDELTLGEVGGGILKHNAAAVALQIGLGKVRKADEALPGG